MIQVSDSRFSFSKGSCGDYYHDCAVFPAPVVDNVTYGGPYLVASLLCGQDASVPIFDEIGQTFKFTCEHHSDIDRPCSYIIQLATNTVM